MKDCSVIIRYNNWIKYNFYCERNLANVICDWQNICWTSETDTNINEKIWNIIIYIVDLSTDRIHDSKNIYENIVALQTTQSDKDIGKKCF